jgi:hypothetical protein
MQARILFVVGLAAGYVLGTRRGREGYDQLKDRAQSLWGNPRVQKTVSSAKSVARDKAPVLSAKVEDAVDKSKATVDEVRATSD